MSNDARPATGERFRVVSTDEAFERGWIPRSTHDYGVYWILCEFNGDRFVREVGSDGGEPEDQSLVRDWKWVAVEMNALHARYSAALAAARLISGDVPALCAELAMLRERVAMATEFLSPSGLHAMKVTNLDHTVEGWAVVDEDGMWLGPKGGWCEAGHGVMFPDADSALREALARVTQVSRGWTCPHCSAWNHLRNSCRRCRVTHGK